MAADDRRELIAQIEALRGSHVLTLVTSLRPGVMSVIAADQVRVVYDHLLRLATRPVGSLDLFLVSNGGEGTVPWRLVSLFREFADRFAVLIPYRAYSAATLLALGADEIVMHPFGELGPIDPTVSNEYNPTDPNGGQRLGISVEDVTAYVNFVKTSVGITHEDELVKALEALVAKVHPLALGNVERFISQSRMIARKILRTHMKEEDQRVIDDIVENMASKLFFHGHPINRREARDELHLKVADDPAPELETLLWALYRDYEAEMRNLEMFNPLAELVEAIAGEAPGGAHPLGPAGYGLPREVHSVEHEIIHAAIESRRLSSLMTTRRRYQTLLMQTPQGLQWGMREDLLSQAWSHSPVP
jgi:Serine dehydrogenase proteinase